MHSHDLIKSYLEPRVTGKRIAILGMAREGISTYHLLRSLFPELEICLLDAQAPTQNELLVEIKEDKYLNSSFGSNYLDLLTNVDIIFKSPGIPILLTAIQDAVNRGAKITSQVDVFFAVFGRQVIAITGTKGKSTASKVMFQVLKYAGKEAIFIGNIGIPAFDALSQITVDTFIVFETSSHQAESITVSPHIAVILNLYQDHLDYYASLDAYGQAKRRLFLRQTKEDLCIYNAQDERVCELVAGLLAEQRSFSWEKRASAVTYVENGQVIAFGSRLIEVAAIPLLGAHNVLNVMPAIIVAEYLGIDAKVVHDALLTIEPVEKRLETVATMNGVEFIDDALATIPEATIAGLAALGDRVETLIVGGFDRGQNFFNLSQAIANSNIKHLICFPSTGQTIALLVREQNNQITATPASSMEEAVQLAKLLTASGKAVLLSTASASFGLFKDYRDRSAQYLRAIQGLG